MGLGAFIPAAINLGTSIYSNISANKRNKEAQKQQVKDQQMLNEEARQGQIDIWKKTNFKEQVKQLKDAGLNTGLLYGMGGTGGATTGAAPSGSASKADVQQMQTPDMSGLSLIGAQKKVLETQAEKNQAEADKIKGVDTAEKQEGTRGTKFQNDLNDLIGIDTMAKNYGWASDKLQVESEKANADWETYVATGYQGKSFHDKDSPVAKAMAAGFEKTQEELKQAKTNNDIGAAERVIKEFEANLAKNGIAPNTPWYVKFITDILDKLELNPFKN